MIRNMIIVHGQNQEFSYDYLSVNPTSLTHNYTAGSLTFDITASGSWTLAESSKALWLTEVPSSGTGNTTVTVTFTENTGAQRTVNVVVTQGTLTATVIVTQLAAPI